MLDDYTIQWGTRRWIYASVWNGSPVTYMVFVPGIITPGQHAHWLSEPIESRATSQSINYHDPWIYNTISDGNTHTKTIQTWWFSRSPERVSPFQNRIVQYLLHDWQSSTWPPITSYCILTLITYESLLCRAQGEWQCLCLCPDPGVLKFWDDGQAQLLLIHLGPDAQIPDQWSRIGASRRSYPKTWIL